MGVGSSLPPAEAVRQPARVRSAVQDWHPPAALEWLAAQGVHVPASGQLAIAREVPLEAIQTGVRLHPFCHIEGAQTQIAHGAELGAGGAVHLVNTSVGAEAQVGVQGSVHLRRCTLGPGTVLGCGAGEDAVFLGSEEDSAAQTTGWGFNARPGTLYEEGAHSAQHTDTKMTILFPWVTLGSGINWCDVLTAGGDDPQRFTEVGSGAVHFNFTPRGDKFASCFGDVPQGVFLCGRRIFVGGNGSLIAPLRSDFGSITPAGIRVSGILGAGLACAAPIPQGEHATRYRTDRYGTIAWIVRSQLEYIGQLSALLAWYTHARPCVAVGEAQRALYAAGKGVVRSNIRERIVRLHRFSLSLEQNLAQSSGEALAQQQLWLACWPQVAQHLERARDDSPPPSSAFVEALQRASASTAGVYTRSIRALSSATRRMGSHWLRTVAEAAYPHTALREAPALQLRPLSR